MIDKVSQAKKSITDIENDLLAITTCDEAVIDLSEFTDLHLSVSDPERSLIFPGPRLPEKEEYDLLQSFLGIANSHESDDFMFNFQDFAFRGHREKNATDGTWYRLRRLPMVSPTLTSLPSTPPSWLTKLLLDENLRGGGLLYFIGSPAQGKTTMASATLVSRLRKFGGYAQTIEDPPEMPLNGWHFEKDTSKTKGFCSQTWVSSDGDQTWADAIKGALRSMPANTPSMLYIGEVRDSDCASTMLRAASNGFLVLATGFATDIPSGLQSLVKIAGDNESTLQMLANSLRLALHLSINNGTLKATPLVSANSRSSVAKYLRAGEFHQLPNALNLQMGQIHSGEDLKFTKD